MLQIAEAVQLTDTGRQREANEDSYFSRAPLFVVADGMGGAQAGEVASRMAVEAFERADEADAAPEELLRRTAQEANREIFDLAQGDSSRSGMGTTLTAALLHGDEISFGHVGDSRAYVFREGKLKQITNDHSLVEELRRQGKLTRDQAAEHPQRSVITRALGPEPQVDVDTMTFSARAGDVFLLCSDGLTTMLDDEDVAAILAREDDLQTAARRLIRAANDRGGRDNITVVIFRLESADVSAGDEGETLVGPSAAAAGLSAEAVRAGAAATGGAAAATPETSAPAAAPPRRRPRRPGAVSPAPKRKWPRRVLSVLVGLLVVAAVAFAAVLGARQVWFVGTNDADQLALYRGLPYDLPFGIELYSEQTTSDVSLQALPETRREVAINHELRSQDDARSLLEDLESAAVTTTTPNGGSGGKGGDGAKQGGAGGGNGGRAGGGGAGSGGGGTPGGGGSPSGGGNG